MYSISAYSKEYFNSTIYQKRFPFINNATVLEVGNISGVQLLFYVHAYLYKMKSIKRENSDSTTRGGIIYTLFNIFNSIVVQVEVIKLTNNNF